MHIGGHALFSFIHSVTFFFFVYCRRADVLGDRVLYCILLLAAMGATSGYIPPSLELFFLLQSAQKFE